MCSLYYIELNISDTFFFVFAVYQYLYKNSLQQFACMMIHLYFYKTYLQHIHLYFYVCNMLHLKFHFKKVPTLWLSTLCLVKVSNSAMLYPSDPSPYIIHTSVSGRQSLAPRANPPPTPRVPKAPGSNQHRGPRGL